MKYVGRQLRCTFSPFEMALGVRRARRARLRHHARRRPEPGALCRRGVATTDNRRWSLYGAPWGATAGNQWQIGSAPKPQEQAKKRCDGLRPVAESSAW
jgi:hypothetical protein